MRWKFERLGWSPWRLFTRTVIEDRAFFCVAWLRIIFVRAPGSITDFFQRRAPSPDSARGGTPRQL